MFDEAQFRHYVQEALEHLYDYAYLRTHPLTALISPAGSRGEPGHALHHVLRTSVDALRPPPDVPQQSAAWRAYQCLCLRYQEMLTMQRVAEELGISPRQCRRAHHDALEAVVAALWQKYADAQEISTPLTAASSGSSITQEAQSLLEVEAIRLAEDPAMAEAHLAESVDGVLATLGPLARARGVYLAAAIPPDTPPVAMSRASLRQVLLSTVHHAIDWAEAGQTALAAISHGQGITLSVVARRLGPAPTEAASAPSTAPHLAVARQIIEPYNGTISVEADATSLVLSLSLPARRPITVLVIDDNPDALRLFGRYLAGGGYRVLEALNGTQALQIAQQTRPAIITLDVMMPGQDGWEVLQTLLSHPVTRGVPVVVCTVLPERDLALVLGAAGFLPKPLTQQQLLEALERCLEMDAAGPATRRERP